MAFRKLLVLGLSLNWSQLCAADNCEPILIQARNMATKVGCGRELPSGYYAQECKGYLEDSIVVDEPGRYLIELMAYGSWAGGSWPKVEIAINDHVIGVDEVSSPSSLALVFQGNLVEGENKVRLTFIEDFWDGQGGDRNLYLGALRLYKAGEDAGIPKSPEIPAGYKLFWADEFNSASLDKNRWTYEVKGDGFGNNELQYYTDRPANSWLQDGLLTIHARRENYQGRHYTSAKIHTRKKVDFTYGRVDVKAQLPKGQGIWPAIWMMPTDSVYGGWPKSGEIDIMEVLGHEPNKTHGTLHFGDPWPHNKNTGAAYVLQQGDFSQGFHIFSVEWEPNIIRWYVDGKIFSTKTPQDLGQCNNGQLCPRPFDRNFYLILNLAVGGNWPGNPDASTMFPQEMKIDYVRVYQKI